MFDSIHPPSNAVRMKLGAVPENVRDIYRGRYIAACSMVSMAIVFITPEQAKAILDSHNRGNRRLSGSWRKIKAAIDRGTWFVNGEAIVFDINGRLLNGQHRLAAIIAAGEPIPVMVLYGCDPDAFSSYDQGKKRIPADILSMFDKQSVGTFAAALTLQNRYVTSGLEKRDSLSNDQVMSVLETFPDMEYSTRMAVTEYRTKRIPPSVVAFLHYQFSLRDKELAASFFSKICRGVGIQDGSTEQVLFDWLDNNADAPRDHDRAVGILARIIRAWNNVRRGGVPLKVVKWNSSQDHFPNIE